VHQIDWPVGNKEPKENGKRETSGVSKQNVIDCQVSDKCKKHWGLRGRRDQYISWSDLSNNNHSFSVVVTPIGYDRQVDEVF